MSYVSADFQSYNDTYLSVISLTVETSDAALFLQTRPYIDEHFDFLVRQQHEAVAPDGLSVVVKVMVRKPEQNQEMWVRWLTVYFIPQLKTRFEYVLSTYLGATQPLVWSNFDFNVDNVTKPAHIGIHEEQVGLGGPVDVTPAMAGKAHYLDTGIE